MNDADTAAQIQSLEADNIRLRNLLEEKNAPRELRHRMRSTLGLLRAIIRHSARTKRDVESYASYLEDRLGAIASAQSMADVTGEIDLGSVLAEALRRQGASEGRRSHLSGPLVLFQPRAGQVFALIAHELAANATEHGALSKEAGRVNVSWRAIEGTAPPRLEFIWTETGGPTVAAEGPPGFGTEVLERLAPYELRAKTDWVRKAGHILCTIVIDLTEAIGRIQPGIAKGSA